MAMSSISSNVKIVDTMKVEVFTEALDKASKSVNKLGMPLKLSQKTKKSYDSFIKSVK